MVKLCVEIWMGASIYDVHKKFGFFYPLPPLCTQNLYRLSANLGYFYSLTPSPFCSDIIYGSSHGEALSAQRRRQEGADVGWGESSLFWMKGERARGFGSDKRCKERSGGERQGLADSYKSGIVIRERPLALLK